MTTPGTHGGARRAPWTFETSRCAAMLLEEIAYEMPEALEWMSAAIMTVARDRRLAEEASSVPHQRGA
jgi:hypothetical protein